MNRDQDWRHCEGLKTAVMQEHLENCSDCRTELENMSQTGAAPVLEPGGRISQARAPSGMTARFLLRARAEGIRLHVSASRHRAPHISKLLPAVAALALVLLAAVSLGHRHPQAKGSETASTRFEEHPAVNLLNRRPLGKIGKYHRTKSRFIFSPANKAPGRAELSFPAEGLFAPGIQRRGLVSLTLPFSPERPNQKLLLASASLGTEENQDILNGPRGSFFFAEGASPLPNLKQPHIDWRQLRVHIRETANQPLQP